MDNEHALDVGYEKKAALFPKHYSKASQESHPLDLRTSQTDGKLDTSVNLNSSVDYSRPSVITPNLQFSSPNTVNQRSRWNHRSHPSIDSDSSFESEQENDNIHLSLWSSTPSGDKVIARMYNHSESLKRRESIGSNEPPDFTPTDTENESEICDSSSLVPKGFYKDLSALTANVSIAKEQRDSMILELSSCNAEIINVEDVQSELKCDVFNLHHSSYDEDSDDTTDNCLQINETESYLEELLKIQAKESNHSKKVAVSAGIQETATKFIKEIRKTKTDMCTQGLNLVVDGNKKQRCLKCNEEFYSVAALLGHLVAHSSRNPGEKLIKCPVCVKRFSTLTTLEIHIQRLHTGEMKYVCQTCEAPFKFSTHLRKHLLNSRCGKGTKKSL